MNSKFISLALACSVALVACGGGGSTGGSMNPVVSPTTVPASDPTLPMAKTFNGQSMWVTQGGLPLYIFNSDTAGVSTCTGSCATIWPPLMAGASSKATGDFTIIARTNPSGSQWAYLGKALYTFASDTANQPPTGNGVQNFSIALVAGQSGAPTPAPGCTGIYC